MSESWIKNNLNAFVDAQIAATPCGCNPYRAHHCGIVDERAAWREAQEREAERLAAPPTGCCTQNCVRTRGEEDRYCVYCRREKMGLPRFPEGDPEGCNLVADRKRAEASPSSGQAELVAGTRVRSVALPHREGAVEEVEVRTIVAVKWDDGGCSNHCRGALAALGSGQSGNEQKGKAT